MADALLDNSNLWNPTPISFVEEEEEEEKEEEVLQLEETPSKTEAPKPSKEEDYDPLLDNTFIKDMKFQGPDTTTAALTDGDVIREKPLMREWEAKQTTMDDADTVIQHIADSSTWWERLLDTGDYLEGQSGDLPEWLVNTLGNVPGLGQGIKSAAAAAQVVYDPEEAYKDKTATDLLRDETSRLESILQRFFVFDEDTPDDVKEAYNRLRTGYQEAELEGSEEWRDAMVDHGVNILTSPSAIVSAVLSYWTGGKAAALQAAAASGLRQTLIKRMAMQALSNKVPAVAARGAGGGGSYAWLHDFAAQSSDEVIERIDEFSIGQNISALGLGMIFGGGITGGISFGASKLAQHQANKIFDGKYLESSVPPGITNEGVDDMLRTGGINPATVDDIVIGERGTAAPSPVRVDEPDVPTARKEARQAQYDRRQQAKAEGAAKEARREPTFINLLEEDDIIILSERYNLDRKAVESVLERFEYEAIRDLPTQADIPLIQEVQRATYPTADQRVTDSMLRQFREYMDARTIAKETNIPEEAVERIADTVDTALKRPAITAADEAQVTKIAEKLSDDLGGGQKTTDEIVTELIDEMQASKVLGRTDEEVTSNLVYRAKIIAANVGTRTPIALKPSVILMPFRKEAKSAGSLQKIFRHDSNRSWETFKPEKEAVGWDFGELFNSIRGGYAEKFKDAILPIALNVKGKLVDGANKALRIAVQGGSINNPLVAEAAGKIRAQLNHIGQELVDSGYLKPEELVENYVPRLWNRIAIKKNPEEFKRLLIEDGQVSAEGAPQLIRDILNKKYEFGEGASGNYFMLGGRRFDKITDDSKYVEFLNNDMSEILNVYSIQAAKNIAKVRAFSRPDVAYVINPKTGFGELVHAPGQTFVVRNLDDYQKAWTDQIGREMIEAGKEVPGSQITEIDNLYRYATGEGLEMLGPKATSLVDYYSTINSMAYLSASALTNIVEPMINIQRLGVKAIPGFIEASDIAFKTVSTDLVNLFKKDKLTRPEIWKELREMSLAMQQAAVSTAERYSGVPVSSRVARGMGNAFYKVTLMHGLNHFTQLTSYISGKKLITDNLGILMRNGGITPHSANQKRHIQTKINELTELNIDIDKGIEWLKRGADESDPFYKDLRMGAARFTRKIYLEPTSESGLKSHLVNNPKWKILFQFLGYPAAYSNTILKEVARSVIKDPVQNVPRTLAAALIMTGTLRFTNWVRSDGKSEQYKTPTESTMAAIWRMGGFGQLADMIHRGTEAAKYSKNPLMVVKGFGGPAGEVLSLSEVGPYELIGGKVPGMATIPMLFGQEGAKKYRRMLRDADKRVRKSFNLDSETKRVGLVEGSVIREEDNIPTVPREPDERKDKMTGIPYNLQAGDAFTDEEDRTPFWIGSLASAGARAVSKGLSEFASSLSDDIVKYSKNPIAKSDADKAAKNIEDSFKSSDPDIPSELDDPEIAQYVKDITRSQLDEKRDLSLEELRLEFPKHFEGKVLIGGKEFSDARGYSPHQSNVFERAGETERALDLDPGMRKVVEEELEAIDALDIPAWQRKFEDFSLQRTGSDLGIEGIQKDVEMAASARKVFLKELRELYPDERAIIKRIGDDLPKVPERSEAAIAKEAAEEISETQRKSNLRDFLRASKEKDKVYRGTYSGFDLDREVNFAFPREIGTHVGTRGQATHIVARKTDIQRSGLTSEGGLTGDAPDEYLFTEGRMTPKQSDEMFEQAGKADVEGYPYSTENPAAITEGYIRVQNPLIMPDLGMWAAGDVLSNKTSLKQLENALREQAQISKGEIATFRSLVKDVDDFYSNPPSAFKTELHEADFNIRLKKFLESLGFDSIKYKNTGEGRFAGEEDFSYILFRANQFKSTWAQKYDPKDPRQNKISGGIVLNALKRRVA